MSQYNSVESALKMVLIFFYFQDYSKSARGMISFLLDICFFTPILNKTAEKPTVMWIFTQNCFESTVLGEWFYFYYIYVITPQYYTKLQKNPQLCDFSLRIFLKTQCTVKGFKRSIPFTSMKFDRYLRMWQDSWAT